jgi:uncharacterized protein
MHPDIERLVDLQAVDMRLNALRARLATFPQQLAEIDKHATDARQQLAAAKEALTSSLKSRKTYEMDVESWKEKARKYRDQSSAVKTNEAYKALQHEIQHAEDEAAQAEDRLLERMMAGETFEPQVKAAELAVKEAERATEGDRNKLKAEYAVVQQELTAKEAERKEKVAKVPEDLFEMYERISLRRHGVGLSEVRDEACSQCGVRIIPHIFQELRRADCFDIFQCETCTRILYYIEPVPAPADATAGAAEPAASQG